MALATGIVTTLLGSMYDANQRAASTPRLFIAILIWVTVATAASGMTRYVSQDSLMPSPPFTNWATAAITIQDAIDASEAGNEILVTNGVYRTGGHALFPAMTNRVAVTKPVLGGSVNGPEVTLIEGYQVPGVTNGAGAVRCVYLTNGAMMAGFTLTNGATRTGGQSVAQASGGGVLCASSSAVLSNCVIVGNSSGFGGGGAYGGTLQFCRIEKDRTGQNGGGAQASVLLDCVISGNHAVQGEGYIRPRRRIVPCTSTLLQMVVVRTAVCLSGVLLLATQLRLHSVDGAVVLTVRQG